MPKLIKYQAFTEWVKQKDTEAREAMLCDIGKAKSEIVHCASS